MARSMLPRPPARSRFAAVPAYVVGLLLILLFGVELQWFPTLGGGERRDLVGRLDHLTLPAIALALSASR